MGVSRTEAAAALSDIEQTTSRSHLSRGYLISGPILMTWGAIWVAGYLATGLKPEWSGAVWLPLDLIGVVASIVLAMRGRSAPGAGAGAAAGLGWRSAIGALAVTAFIVVTFNLFRPVDPQAPVAYPGLICGLVYVIMGVWRMTRFAWIGAAMFVATLIGYRLFPDILPFWMAAVGGGGLMLGGLWMRRA
ncbi:MAG: hypothetical protein J7521_03365 [Caulobacter sp.]|nr:hypothetical protein [Caulobacter sp.]